MPFAGRALSSLDVSDLTALINNDSVTEGLDLDYKITLPESSDDKKKEFLADVTSFANAGGGHLIFGMDESAGVATSLAPIVNVNTDEKILQLENMLRDGVTPRLSGVGLFPVEVADKEYVFVMRVPQSFRRPHMVALKNDSKFYARNSRGKYQLDVHQLRDAFVESESIRQKIRNFRLDRIAMIRSGETPTPMKSSGKLVLHLMPLAPLVEEITPSMTTSYDVRGRFHPIDHAHFIGDLRPNFDGVAGMDPEGYVQIFREGWVESVDTSCLEEVPKYGRMITAAYYEERLMEACASYLQGMKLLGIEPPLVAALSLVDIKGYAVVPETRIEEANVVPIPQEVLLMPDILLDSLDLGKDEIGRAFRSWFDRVFQACGLNGSRNFDAKGNWKKTENMNFRPRQPNR